MAAFVRVNSTPQTPGIAVGNDTLLDYKRAAFTDKNSPALSAAP